MVESAFRSRCARALDAPLDTGTTAWIECLNVTKTSKETARIEWQIMAPSFQDQLNLLHDSLDVLNGLPSWIRAQIFQN